MKTCGKKIAAVFILMAALAGPPGAFGDDAMGARVGHKLMRGMANTFTGWFEIPKHMYLRSAEGPIVLGTLQGVVEGVGMGFARTTAGLYEVATFALPVPGHYGPLFEPEFVWERAEDEGELSLRQPRALSRPRLLDPEGDENR